MSRWSFAKKLRHLGVVASVLLALFSPLTLASPAQAATGDGLKWYEKAQAGSTVGLSLDTNIANYTPCGTSTTINYAWASSSTGCTGRPETDGFTNYWTGYIKAPSTGTLIFYNQSDDGFIVKINGTLVIDNWVEQGASATYNASGSFSMTAGTYYQIQVFHHENAGGADARLYWNYGGSQTIIPQTYLFSTTVAPDAPTSVTASGATATSLNVSWTAPADPGTSAISDYTIQYSSNSGSSWSTFSHTASSSTSATVTGLTRTTSYIFKVAAVTTVGTGSYSTTSTAVSTAAAVPGAPTGLAATSNADAQSVVSWTAPSDNGGAAITSYKVEYSSDGTNFNTATTAATGTSYTVTGLTNGTTYTFRVSAINSAGTGSASATTTATTKGTALTPVFGSPTFSNGTWTIPVTNYDAAWTWTTSATNSATVATPVISGSTITFTVTPTAGTTSALTVYAKRTGYFDGSATSTAYYPGCNPTTIVGSVYTSLKFTATTTCQYIAPVAANYDYLVVAGGGSGGDRAGGGGGAGGYLTSVGTPANRINLSTSQILTITVGAGGVGYTSMHHGANGQDSVLQYTSTITSKGGGGGGTGSGGSVTGVNGSAYDGASGGSGGGPDGAGAVGTATGTPSTQGNNGGLGSSGASAQNWTGGGGGGAGSAGTAGSTDGTAGSGGSGLSNSISGTLVCYAAGGGGGNQGSVTTSPGAGGSCSGVTSGGAGSKGNAVAGAGVANTGSGGGGSGFLDGSGDGTPGSGGSGIVVLRYATAAPVPTLTVTNQTTTGLTVNVTNYDANFTYTTSLDAGSGTAGTPVISGTNYAIPFTAVTAGSSLTVKVQASLAGATTGVATTSGTALQNSQTISFTSTKPSTAVVGGTAYTVTATATSTLAVTFSVDATSTSVCALSGSTVTFQAAGTCQINANQAGNSQWAAAPQVYQSFTVGRGTQAALSVTSLSGTYGSTVALTYSGGTGTGAITFAVVAGGTATGCSITGTTLSYTSAGTCLVTVTQAADSNWSSATSTTATINIAKIAQTITFAQPANRTITSGTFTAVASTTASGQSVTVNSTTSAVCNVTNNVVTLVGLGACTLTADVATSTNYLAATTVTQTFTVSSVTVTLNANGGTGTTANLVISSASGANLTANAYKKNGFAFGTWNTIAAGGGTSYTNGQLVNFAADTTLYAQWVGSTYTVTFDKNYTGSTSTTGTYVSNGTVTLPTAPVRSGYTFNGWATASSGGTNVGSSGNVSAMTSSGLILNYSIGDSTSYNGSGTAITDIASQLNTGVTGSLDGTTYSSPAYTVGPPANLNIVGTSSQYIYSGNMMPRLVSGSVKYSFFTWVYPTANDGSIVDERGQVGGGWQDTQMQMVGGKPRFGIWTGSQTEVTSANALALNQWYYMGITYDGSTLRGYVNGVQVASTAATRQTTNTGAWYLAVGLADGTGASVQGNFRLGAFHVYNVDLSVDNVLRNYKADCAAYGTCAGLTFYAQWTASTQTITYAPNNGTGTITAQTAGTDTSVTLASTGMNRTGYTLAGWNTSADGTGTPYALGASILMPVGGLSLYAQWTANSYVVTYNTQGGSAVSNGSYTTSGSITLPAAPNRANYSFAGWFLTATGGSALGATYSPPGTAALTIYAQWIALATAPTITQQPSAIAKTVGQTATFTALASTADGGVISYQWYKGTTPISGATSATYSFVTTATTDAGSYKVVATNTLNGGTATTTSNVVTLTMSGALAVSTPSTGLSGTYGGAFSLDLTSIATGGTGTYTYAVTSGSLPGGATMTAGVINSSNLTAAGSFPIVVTVTDGNSATIATNSFTLVVAQAAQSITFAQPANRTVTSGTFAVTGTSSSGSPVTFTIDSGSSAVCSISSGTVTLLGVGACVITANAASTTNYLAASPLSRTVTVSGVTITFAANGGTGSTSAKVITSPSGNALTANSFVRSGYSFAGWSTTSGTATVAYADAQVVGLTSDTTLYAQWTANNYSVTYYPINATSGSAPTDSGTYTIGNNATVLGNTGTLVRTGYTFAGWTTASDGSGTVYVAGNTLAIGSANINLYAKWTANPYSVTYSATTSDGGTVPVDSTIYNISQSVSVRGNTGTLTRSGYTFAGWTVAANGSGTVLVSGDSYTVGSSNITFYAKWTAVPYTATYSASTATSGSVPTDASTYNIGGTVTVLGNTGNLQRTGYTFAGWTTAADGTGTVLTSGATFAVAAANVTLYAKWTPINYSITYNSNNATSGSVPADATNYNIGQYITVRGNTGTLVRTGYSFAGWNLAADGTGTNYQSGNQLLVGSANVTLYAKWTPNTYTVSYNANGASGALVRASETYTTAGTAVTLPGQGTLAKTGYNFGGWATTPNGSALSGTYTTAANVTLYAVWTIKSVAINYLPGIAQGLQFNMFPANTTANFGTAISVGSGVDGRVQINGTSYDFAGWNDTNSIYQSGSPYTLGDTDVTFTAVWVPVYAVRYIFNGGTPAQGESSIDSQCGGLDSTCNLNQIITTNQAPYRAGYNFEGWIDQSANLIAAGSQTAVTGSSYLYYASWTPVNYTVNYNADGGSTAPTQASRTIGQTFTVGNAVTKTGYSFAGWSDGVQVYGSGATYTVGTSNVSLTAQWTPDIYTVTYDWNGGHGTTTSDDLYTVGTTDLTLPVVGDHVKDGFNFNGWSTSPTGNLLGLTYVPTASTTLYAVWGTGSYVLTMNANGGTVATSSYSVPNGTAQTLPTPTRTHFHFDGWFDAASNGNLLGMGGDDFTPASSKTLYAHWTQDSLVGMGASDKLGNLTASSTVRTRVSVFGPNNTVTVDVPAGALPTGTLIDIYLLRDTSRAASLISGANTFLVNLVVSWLAGDGTVPSTATGVPVKVTIEDPNIKAGAAVYSLIGSTVTYLATATVDGQVTAFITDDPELVVAAVVPGAPTSVSATAGNGTAVVSWSAPSTDGGSPITSYVVTSSGGQTCTATSSLSCTVSGLTNGTSYTFTVQAVNAVGNSVSSSASSAVTPLGPQSISFGALNNKTMGTGTVSLSAVATSGLQVAFSTSSTGYCSISGSVLNLVGAGPCTVVASQAGGSGYLAAQQVSQSFTIAPALTLATPTGSALAATYNTAYTLALTSSGGAGSSTFAVTSGSLPAGLTMDGSTGVISGTPTAATSANLSITVTDANSATATASFTINVSAAGQSALTITTTTGTFGTPLPLFASGGSSTGSVSFAVVGGTTTCTLSGSNLSTTGAGTCLVTATRAADSNYSSVSSAPTTVTINKASQAALTLTSTSGTYLTPLQLSVSGGSGLGAVTYAVAAGSTTCTVSAGQLSAAGAGTCLVTATKASDDNYLSESSAQTTVNFAAANQTALSITSLNGSFGLPLQLVTSGGSGLGNVSYVIASGTTTCSLNGTLLSASGAGSCLVTATKAADANFTSATSTQASVSFGLGTQSAVNLTSLSGTYLTPLVLTANGGSGNGGWSFTVANGTTGCSFDGTSVTTTGAGNCLVTATRAADSNYNAQSSAQTTVTFGRASQTISFSAPQNKTLGMSAFAVSATSTSSLPVSFSSTTPAVCTVTSGTVSLVAAGSCVLQADQAGNANYSSANAVQRSFTVSPALTIATPSAGLNGFNTVPFVLTLSSSGGAGSNAYAISSGTLPTGLNLDATTGEISGTSSSASTSSIVVSVTDANGAVAHTSSFTIVISQLSQATFTLVSLSGTYGSPLQLSAVGGSGNGAVSYVIAAGTTTCTLSGTTLTAMGAGTCLVTATKAADGGYASVSTAATTVSFGQSSQAALSMTSGTGTALAPVTLNATGGSGTGQISYSVTNGTATCALVGAVLTPSTAGTCSVTATKAGDANYTQISATPVTYTFALATQAPLSVSSLTGTATVPLALTTTGGSGTGAISFSVASGICTLANGSITATAAGTCLVTATKAADAAYSQVASAQATITFSAAPVVAPPAAAPAPVTPPVVIPTVNIPAKPETWVAPEVAPVVTTGQNVVVVNDVVTPVSTSVTADKQGITVVTPDWQFSLKIAASASPSATPADAVSGTQLVVSAGATVAVAGEQFQAGTQVKVWLRSTPQLLGLVTVNPDGSFASSLPIPAGLEIGNHTLVLQGLNNKNELQNAQASLLVKEPGASTATTSTVKIFFPVGGARVSFVAHRGIVAFMHAVAGLKNIVVTASTYYLHASSRPLALKIGAARSAVLMQQLRRAGIAAKVVTTAHQTTQRSQVGQLFDVAITASAN
jgi:uncharacterized repeat protein (TIGR02543 family)